MASPLVFHVSQRPDGTAFGFPLVTERELKERARKAGLPEVHLAERIFIALPTIEAVESTRTDLWRQMLTLLTGLSPGQLATLGGWRFIDPTTGREFAAETPAEHAA